MSETPRICIKVPYWYTDAELKALGERLAQENQTVYKLRGDKKVVGSDFKARIDDAEAKAADTAHKICERNELRDTECHVIYDAPQRGFKQIVRIDTSDIIRTEPMTETEMQTAFVFDPEASTATPQKGRRKPQ